MKKLEQKNKMCKCDRCGGEFAVNMMEVEWKGDNIARFKIVCKSEYCQNDSPDVRTMPMTAFVQRGRI